MTVDFGFIPTMSLGSTVFADPNNDGIQNLANPLEDGLPNVPVQLYDHADNDGDLNDAGENVPVLTTTTMQWRLLFPEPAGRQLPGRHHAFWFGTGFFDWHQRAQRGGWQRAGNEAARGRIRRRASHRIRRHRQRCP